MSCPLTPELWYEYREHGSPEVAAHLATCAACRAEAGRLAHLHRALSVVPQLDAPPAVADRLQRLAIQLGGQSLSCADTLVLLEAWRDGALDRAQAFLVEEHLLWCAPCAQTAETAEQLSAALRALPALTPPAVIAERIAAARVPWWQRLMPAPAPSLAHAGLAMGALAAALLFAVLVNGPHRPQEVVQLPSGNITPRHTVVTPLGPESAIAEVAIPVTPGVATDRHASLRSPIINTPSEGRTITVVGDHTSRVVTRTTVRPTVADARDDTVVGAPSATVPPPTVTTPPSEIEEPSVTETLIAMVADTVDDASFRYNAEDAVVDSHELAMLAAEEQSLSCVSGLQDVVQLVRRPQPRSMPNPATSNRSLRPEIYRELGTTITKEAREDSETRQYQPLTNGGEKHNAREIDDLTILRTDI